MAITETWLKANYKKPRRKIFNKTDRDGLLARVSVAGKITYSFRYYYEGKQTRTDIGTYPLISLKEAREEILRLKKKLEQGHDPKIIRKLERQDIVEAPKLKILFELWYKNYCIDNKKGHFEIKRSFEIHIFPELGCLPARDVSLHHWLALLEPLAKRSPAIAERLLVNTKQLYKWGVKRKLLELNPLADIYAKADLQINKRSTDRVLSEGEIKMVWLAIDGSRITLKNKLFVKLCLIYGCRSGELRQSEKKHFDFKRGVWTVPPENHKLGKSTGKPLVRPIILPIMDYLSQAFELSSGSEFVFTNEGTADMMSNGAPLQIPYNVMQYLRRREGYEMPHFSMHDLRRTARTQFSNLTDFRTAEIMLGHSSGRFVNTYDHYDYLEEQAEAYTKWCKRLFSLVNDDLEPEPANNNNVIRLDKWRRA